MKHHIHLRLSDDEITIPNTHYVIHVERDDNE